MILPFHDPQQKINGRILLACFAVLMAGCLIRRAARRR